MNNEQLMRRAIALSEESVRNGGGPFGAVIARQGVIVAEASNSVTIDNDPTAHAEVNCIRRAAERLRTFDLSGCEIYTSCEPCPMCLGAIYWALVSILKIHDIFKKAFFRMCKVTVFIAKQWPFIRN